MLDNKNKIFYIYTSVVLLLTLSIAIQIIENSNFLHRKNTKDGMDIARDLDRFRGFVKIEEEKFHRNITINFLGFKDDKNWSIEKPKDEYRIVALGDSMTEGIGVGTQETWPEQLEEKLNKRSDGKTFEVMNFAPSKFDSGTPEEYKTLANRSLKYNPDMIILQYYNNDWRSVNIKERSKVK